MAKKPLNTRHQAKLRLMKRIRTICAFLLVLSIMAGLGYTYRYPLLISYINFRLSETPLSVKQLKLDWQNTHYPTIQIASLALGYHDSAQEFELLLNNITLKLNGLPHENPSLSSFTAAQASLSPSGLGGINIASLTTIGLRLIEKADNSQLKAVVLNRLRLTFDGPEKSGLIGTVRWSPEVTHVDMTGTLEPDLPIVLSFHQESKNQFEYQYLINNSSHIKIYGSANQIALELSLTGDDFLLFDQFLPFESGEQVTLSATFDSKALNAIQESLLADDNYSDQVLALMPHFHKGTFSIQKANAERLLGRVIFKQTLWKNIHLDAYFDMHQENNRWFATVKEQTSIEANMIYKNTSGDTQEFQTSLYLPSQWSIEYGKDHGLKVSGHRRHARLDLTGESVELKTRLAATDLAYMQLEQDGSKTSTLDTQMHVIGQINQKPILPNMGQLKAEIGKEEWQARWIGKMKLELPNNPLATSFHYPTSHYANLTLNATYQVSQQQGMLNGKVSANRLQSFLNDAWKQEPVAPKAFINFFDRLKPGTQNIDVAIELPWNYWPPVPKRRALTLKYDSEKIREFVGH